MIKYIQESNKRMQNRKEYMLYRVPVYIIKKFPKSININRVLDIIKTKLSAKNFDGLEAIYVGDFKDLNERDLVAMLKDDAIWVSSNNIYSFMTDEIIADNIIHEVAHLIEDRHYNFIYGDNKIEKEYDSKKYKLLDILKSEGYNVFEDLFFSHEYLNDFDTLLYKKVGYDKLALLSLGLFISPYSITTLREYFANGFQMFFSDERNYLKEVNPTLYTKIKELIFEVENGI